MVEEAERSGWKSIEGCIEFLSKRLLEISRNRSLSSSSSSSSWWRAYLHYACRKISKKILDPYKYELVFLVSFFVEYRTITSKATAMFWESLYGGKRVKLGAEQDQGSTGSSASQRTRQLRAMKHSEATVFIFLRLFEVYLVQRCDHHHSRLKELPPAAIKEWEKRFLKWYPYLRKSLIGANLFFQFRYMLGKSVFFDPYSQAMGLVVRRVTQEDQASITTQSPNGNTNNDATILKSIDNRPFDPLSILKQSPLLSPLFKRRVAFWLLSSTAAIRMLARIRSARQDHSRYNATTGRITGRAETQSSSTQSAFEKIASKGASHHPPPPLPAQGASRLLATLAERSPGTCPLCRQTRFNPTASTGGYVFCLKCLSNYVNDRGTCPVTGKACSTSSMVRLFEPHRS